MKNVSLLAPAAIAISRRRFHGIALLAAGAGLAGCQGGGGGLLSRSSATGADWFELARSEHRAADALFQRILSSGDPQERAQLRMKLSDALSRHALQEENVVYPALQMSGLSTEPRELFQEHAQVKIALAELEALPPTHPTWLKRVQDLRAIVQEHVQDEETRIYPGFRQRLSPDQNALLTQMYRREGAKFSVA